MPQETEIKYQPNIAVRPLLACKLSWKLCHKNTLISVLENFSNLYGSLLDFCAARYSTFRTAINVYGSVQSILYGLVRSSSISVQQQNKTLLIFCALAHLSFPLAENVSLLPTCENAPFFFPRVNPFLSPLDVLCLFLKASLNR